jgi:hypothetical protein
LTVSESGSGSVWPYCSSPGFVHFSPWEDVQIAPSCAVFQPVQTARSIPPVRRTTRIRNLHKSRRRRHCLHRRRRRPPVSESVSASVPPSAEAPAPPPSSQAGSAAHITSSPSQPDFCSSTDAPWRPPLSNPSEAITVPRRGVVLPENYACNSNSLCLRSARGGVPACARVRPPAQELSGKRLRSRRGLRPWPSRRGLRRLGS